MDIINSSPQQPQQNQPPQAPKPEQPVEQQPQLHEPVVSHVHHGSKKKAVLRIILTLIVAALAAASVYYWQQGKASDLKSQLEAKTAENATLKQQAETANDLPAGNNESAPETDTTPATTISEDLIAGNTDTNRTDGKVLIDAVFKRTLNPSALWVEYGTDPSKLDKATEKITKGLGAGDSQQPYALGFTTVINNSQLTPGTNYYYRTAATVSGKTLYSGVATFVTTK